MLISDAKAKRTSGGYARIFDDEEAGAVFSRAHATNIRNGNELETIITDASRHIPDDDLDAFISNSQEDGTYLCTKKAYKRSSIAVAHHEPNLLIFIISDSDKKCLIIELKDGDDFDTKKSDGEHDSLETCHSSISKALPEFSVSYFLCCFNQDSRARIVDGLKRRFDIAHVMTGRELCHVLNIDYDAIRRQRASDAIANRKELVRELMSVGWFRKYANEVLRQTK